MSRLGSLLILPLLLGQTAPPASWRTFAPKEGGFTVSLPSTPKEKRQELKLPAGTTDVVTYTCDGPKDVALVVAVTEFPESAVQGDDEKRLRNAREGAVQNSKGKLDHERKITLAGFPGRELWITFGKDDMIHMRLYAVQQRLYQTMAVGAKTAVETKEVAGFMDSFKLKK